MRYKTMIFSLLLAASAAHAHAQDPSFLNQVYYYRADSLVPLAKAEGHLGSKTKALGFGGSQTGYTMEGERSAVRLRSMDSMRFVVKFGSTMMDPSSMIQLYRFESKKGSRLALISDQGRFGSKDVSKNQVHFDVQKSGTDVYILVPSEKLVPGEYGFLNMMTMNSAGGGGRNMSFTFYSFGIDP